jgi:hypothetical protein
VQARTVISTVGAVVTAALLAWSIVRDLPRTHSVLRGEHARFASYTRVQRDQAFGALLPLQMSNFDWYRRYLHPGDRYYVQIEPAAFSSFIDKDTLVRRVAHLYLLPNVEARNLDDATVVLSWDDDPGRLHRRYATQVRLGEQNFFVSRISRG